MGHYIRDRLRDLEPEQLNRLAPSITGKVNGIFLWVALVVRSIRARMEDGHDFSVMEEEINSLPDELEGLFRHLLGSISKTYQKRAYQTFTMVELSRPRPGRSRGFHTQSPRLTLLAYSFLDEYSTDSEFAQRQNSLFVGLGNATKAGREEAARKKLNAQCQGLVEPDHESFITYTHRSVSEFLGKHLRSTVGSIIPGFEPAQAFSQLLLAEVRIRPRDPYWIHRTGRSLRNAPRISDLLQVIMTLRDSNGLDYPPFQYLEALGSAAQLAFRPESRPVDIYWISHHMAYNTLCLDPPSLLFAATCCGMQAYVDWRIRTEPSIIEDYDTVAMLACLATISGIFTARHSEPMNPFDIFGVLLRRGVLPDAVVHTTHWTTAVGFPLGLGFWEHFVFYLIVSTSTLRTFHVQHDCPTDAIGAVIQEFLKHGANPELDITLEGEQPLNDIFGCH